MKTLKVLTADLAGNQFAPARFVIPVRNPLEVAASLKERNDLSTDQALLLWLRHVLEVERDTRQRQTTDLVAGVTKLEAERAARLGTTDEQRLITTPLLVRMLLIVHFNLRRLPDQRAELYMAIVDTLLTADYHPDEAVAQRLARLGGDWRTRREMLQYLAFRMHSEGQNAGREIGEQALTE